MTCRYCGAERTERNDRAQCMNRAPTHGNLRPTHVWRESPDARPFKQLNVASMRDLQKNPKGRPWKIIERKEVSHGG